MIELITNNTLFNYLYILITIVLIINYVVTNFITKEDNNKSTIKREANPLKWWMGIIHISTLIIFIVLIFKIQILHTIMGILSFLCFLSMILIYFIQVCSISIKLKNKELNNIEILSFLYFPYLALLVFNKSNGNNINELLILFNNTYPTTFQCFFIFALLIKVFFLCFFTLYSIFILLKDLKTLLVYIKNKLDVKFQIYNNIFIKFLFSMDWYFYDFKFYEKYKKYKLLIPLLFFLDLIISIIVDIFTFYIYILRFPIWILTIGIKYFYNILVKICNSNIALFVFKWFRIVLIISILITYIILKTYNLNIKQPLMEIFELISTVILIPLILEQVSKLNGNNN